MNMNRRNVLVGLGTAAVGTGAAFGSGAFTQIEAEREVNVEIADDAEAAIAFDAEDDVDGVDNSQLHIDLSQVNEDSTILLGEHDDSAVNNAAFSVDNNTDEATQFDNGVEVDISAEADLDASGAEIEFYAENDNGEFEELTDSSLTLVDENDSADVAVEIGIETAEIDEELVTFTAEVAE